MTKEFLKFKRSFSLPKKEMDISSNMKFFNSSNGRKKKNGKIGSSQ